MCVAWAGCHRMGHGPDRNAPHPPGQLLPDPRDASRGTVRAGGHPSPPSTGSPKGSNPLLGFGYSINRGLRDRFGASSRFQVQVYKHPTPRQNGSSGVGRFSPGEGGGGGRVSSGLLIFSSVLASTQEPTNTTVFIIRSLEIFFGFVPVFDVFFEVSIEAAIVVCAKTIL